MVNRKVNIRLHQFARRLVRRSFAGHKPGLPINRLVGVYRVKNRREVQPKRQQALRGGDAQTRGSARVSA
jgi:hypothetical protein